MPKKKILVAGNSLDIGGIQKAFLSLVNTLPSDEYDIDILMQFPFGEYKAQLHSNVNLLPSPKDFYWIFLPKGKVLSCIFRLLLHPVCLFYFVRNLLKGLSVGSMTKARQWMWRDCISALPPLEEHYDIALDFSGLLRRYVLEKVDADRKYTWIHSDYRVMGLDATIDKELLTRFDGINCVSRTCKEIFDEIFPDLAFKTRVELNRVDVRFIMSQINGQGFDDGFDGLRILDVTRIDPNKGLDVAVQVCSELKKRGKVFKWYILGNDPLGYKATLEKLIREYEVQDCFILLGFTSNPYPYMYEADIIAHFSRFEGRSVTIDEALALNKPVLLTNYPTAKDQITDGVNGYIRDFDVPQLANQIECMMAEIHHHHDI